MPVVLYDNYFTNIFVYFIVFYSIYSPSILVLLLFKFAKITTFYYLEIHLLLSCF